MRDAMSRPPLLSRIGPGLLVAATGVGAGDLATASFTGSRLGTAVLWAVVVGAFLKFVLNEGLARWQLATGETLLEGVVGRIGRWTVWLFLPYLLLWSFFVASALMSACGVAVAALVPVFDDPARGKLVFGIAASALGLALVFAGGFRLFEKIMSVCIAVMFVIVVVTAALLWPGTADVVRGLVVPVIPDIDSGGLAWTVALLGGVGGTLTVLCYGYWIREEGRGDIAALPDCRLDLGLGYTMTALFGVAMVIVGSQITIEGSGAGLLVTLADRLAEPLGPAGRWLFLVGVLGAVFSSLLGVWQSVPYLFADLWRLSVGDPTAPRQVDTAGLPYRLYLVALAVIPIAGLTTSFREIQKLYAVTGALFIPLLAVVLLALNGRRDWMGANVNRRTTALVLVATVVFFGALAWIRIAGS